MFVIAELPVAGHQCNHFRVALVAHPGHTHQKLSAKCVATQHCWGAMCNSMHAHGDVRCLAVSCHSVRMCGQRGVVRHASYKIALFSTTQERQPACHDVCSPYSADSLGFGAQQLRPLQGLGHSTWPASLQAFCGNIVRWQQGWVPCHPLAIALCGQQRDACHVNAMQASRPALQPQQQHTRTP